MYYSADIGIIGGSGFYNFGENPKRVTLDTKWGKPSGVYNIVDIKGKKVAFLPRHGKDHTLNPSEINYRANIDGFAQLGVKCVISSCCVGSLRLDYAPGDFVVVDQYINATSGRKDSFFESPNVVHLSSADPYHGDYRKFALEEGKKLGYTIHDGGTITVINGPRFSTRAESKMYKLLGADVINMTQYPEAYLCMEKNIPVITIALVTDYDAGIEGDPTIAPVTDEEATKVLLENTDKVRALVTAMISRIGRK